jgi:Mn2+/Fe2+ NRAMP family transporter
VVTAGLLINLLKLPEISVSTAALGLFIIISAMLIFGRYKFLEISLKFVVSILFVALLVTTAMVIFKGQVTPVENFVPPSIFNEVGVLFLIGLVGWMPTTVEASSWISLWTIEKFKVTGAKLSLKQALQEFDFGYFMTALLALFFLIIGWMTLYGTHTELSGNAVTFADQLVTLFTGHIGIWSYIFIATAAFATMFSTCITAHDAISRVSVDIIELLFPKDKPYNKRLFFSIMVILLAAINFVVISFFGANMGQLVALATFISFVLAPVIGYMNLKNVMSEDLPEADRPKKGLRILTYLGIVFLSLFAIYYFWIVVM